MELETKDCFHSKPANLRIIKRNRKIKTVGFVVTIAKRIPSRSRDEMPLLSFHRATSNLEHKTTQL